MVIGMSNADAPLTIHSSSRIIWTRRKASLGPGASWIDLFERNLPREPIKSDFGSRFNVFSSQTVVSGQYGLLGVVAVLVSAFSEPSCLCLVILLIRRLK
jgi:hypothetical protein